jgi:protein-tyrosine kinase
MSRIDEAMRQAGLSTGTTADRTYAGALDSFPEDRPRAAAEPSPAAPPSAPVASSPAHATAVAEPLPAFAEKLVILDDADPVSVEQYRRLAAVLHQAQVERGIKVLMVASAQVGEGKTLTAANLALTLSESYHRKVLLIDADLRRPSLSVLFRVPERAGLSEILQSDGDLPLRITDISERLALLPGGAPDADPMAGLTSGQMQQILEQASEAFEWVILDTPPIGLISDAHLLASMVDGTVLVIRAGSTPCAPIQRAIEALTREKILGVVLNRAEGKDLSDTSYYDYYQQPRKPLRKRTFMEPTRTRTSRQAPPAPADPR